MKRREFKNVCKDLIDDLEITQAEFAKKIKTSQATVSKWLNGKQEPRFFQLQNIAITFNIDVNFLLGLTSVFSMMYHAFTVKSESSLSSP